MTWFLTRAPEMRRRALLVLIGLMPLVFLRTTNSAFGVPKLTLLLLVVPALAALRTAEVLQGSEFTGFRRLGFPAAALAGALTLAWVFSPYRAWALWGDYDRFLGLIPYLLTMMLGILVADAFEDLTPVAWLLTGAGVIASVYGIVQFLGLDPLNWNFESYDNTTAASTLGNPNFTGGFLAMCLPVALALWFRVPQRRRELGIVGAALALGWIATDSQGGWAAGIAGLAVTGGVMAATRWRLARVAGVVAAGAIALILVGVVVAGALLNDSRVPSAARSRGWLWQAAVGMAASSPLVGRGPHAYAIESTQHRTIEHAFTQGFNYADDPHSLPLNLAASAGVLGVLAFLVIVWWLMRTGFDVATDDPLSAGFFGAGVAYLVQSLISIETVPLRATFWVVLGALAAGVASFGQKKPRPRKTSRKRSKAPQTIKALPAVAGLLVLGLASIVWSIGFLLSDARFAQANALYRDGDGGAAEEAYRDAIGFHGEVQYRRVYGTAMGNLAIDIARSGDLELAKDLFGRADEALSFTDDIPIVAAMDDRARLLQRWGGVTDTETQALEIYERAIELDRYNPLLRVVTANVLLSAARPADALKVLEPVLSFIERVPADLRDNVHPAFWEMLGDVREELGDLEGAREARERLGEDPE